MPYKIGCALKSRLCLEKQAVPVTEEELFSVNGGKVGGGYYANPKQLAPDISDPMPTEGYEFEFRNGIRLRIM